MADTKGDGMPADETCRRILIRNEEEYGRIKEIWKGLFYAPGSDL